VVWFLAVVIVLVVGAAVVVALGRGGAMRQVYDDRPDALVPADRPLSGEAVRTVRFSVGLRGYRTDEVDALLARLADQLDDRRDDQRDEQRDDQHDAEERR
jgi:DivIVA domain-containing protein